MYWLVWSQLQPEQIYTADVKTLYHLTSWFLIFFTQKLEENVINFSIVSDGRLHFDNKEYWKNDLGFGDQVKWRRYGLFAGKYKTNVCPQHQ